MNRSRLIPLALLSAIATACGGGGSEPPPTLTVTPSATSVEVGENTSTQITFATDYTGSEEVSYIVAHGGSFVTEASFSSSILHISVDEMTEQTEDQSTAEIRVEAGDLSESFSIDITAVNTSAKAALSWADTVAANSGAITNMEDLNKVAGFYANSAFYLGRVSGTEKEQLARGLSNSPELSKAVKNLSDAVAVFRGEGERIDGRWFTGLDESGLSEYQQAVIDAAALCAKDRIADINELSAVASLPLPLLKDVSLHVDPEAGTASYLLGDPAYGEYDLAGNWVFSSEFAKLAPLFNNNQCSQ